MPLKTDRLSQLQMLQQELLGENVWIIALLTGSITDEHPGLTGEDKYGR